LFTYAVRLRVAGVPLGLSPLLKMAFETQT
jgi:hypothetical protein